MNIAVRYYSRSGNTKAVAEAIAKAANVDAVSVDGANSEITEKADVLFIGGALYAYGIDEHLKSYLSTLTKDKAQKAVIFSTSWISKHAIDVIKKTLSEKGIPVEDKAFYVRNKPSEAQLKAAEEFAKSFI